MNPVRKSEFCFEILKNPIPFAAHGQHALVQELQSEIRRQYLAQGGDGSIGGPFEIEIVYNILPPRTLVKRVTRGEPVLPSGMSSPGIDKLTQVVLQALQHVVYSHECQIVTLLTRKVYGLTGGYVINVRHIDLKEEKEYQDSGTFLESEPMLTILRHLEVHEESQAEPKARRE